MISLSSVPFISLGKLGYACSTSVGYLSKKAITSFTKPALLSINNFKVATFPPVNTLSASMSANDALKFLGGYGNLLFTDRRVDI
ncbi:hypothetical protein Q649_01274 [Bartonella quintana JK 73]|uniref:Uncharacterized protein n=2 Tax=Bartonella quintana TaxID=803 RepID=W3U0B6_BARQI|nr:hypothetical protein Q651_01348 [Bartonella quintana BQ2-D70]ETS14622.1 hypothetical protein Q650_01265 [Bartonella quintana JK 73rel]ETS16309.1 hypothetical protein Q649_01274 [Bartonella quintana JK 73]KEC60257.1 hypothetical protein O93_00005 [Bartonella quintana JK 19]KEC60796.1 hypothetical protein O91_00978 [Bartonella quintana JK 31]KEC63841.1 hypothetical protein O7W_01314 [Bartonella quintana JK 56]KEC64269.1 hypothetical protein O7Y_00026 [Bartonella quintana JK 63]KEC66808.1 hy